MIEVKISDNCEHINPDCSGIRHTAEHICSRFGIRQATISISILNSEDITSLNRKFLNHDWATDCISFDLSEHGQEAPSEKIFEIIVNGQKAIEQASRRSHNPEAELALYIVHGILHNLGFNDSTKTESDRMHKTEDQILNELGYGTVFYDQTDEDIHYEKGLGK